MQSKYHGSVKINREKEQECFPWFLDEYWFWICWTRLDYVYPFENCHRNWSAVVSPKIRRWIERDNSNNKQESNQG